MIIDFHTHIFPDKIASKTIAHLAAKSGFTPFADGTAKGLLGALDEAGADIAISLPVLTNPEQFDSVNRFAATVNEEFKEKGKGILSFAGMHPACDDIKGKMAFIKESGFLGVKIHPDYQDTYINDDGYLEILRSARELDLIVVTHSGVDGGYRDRPVRCAPSMVKEVIRKVGYEKFVLAHFGANELWDETYDILSGENVYFDTAFTLRYIDPKLFKKVIDRHGADRILFATDSPWGSIKQDVEIFRSCGLDKTTEEKILSGNARRLLGI